MLGKTPLWSLKYSRFSFNKLLKEDVAMRLVAYWVSFTSIYQAPPMWEHSTWLSGGREEGAVHPCSHLSHIQHRLPRDETRHIPAATYTDLLREGGKPIDMVIEEKNDGSKGQCLLFQILAPGIRLGEDSWIFRAFYGTCTIFHLKKQNILKNWTKSLKLFASSSPVKSEFKREGVYRFQTFLRAGQMGIFCALNFLVFIS